MTTNLADELAVVLAYWKRKYEVIATEPDLVNRTADLLKLATRGQVEMKHEDLGMEICGGTLKPGALERAGETDGHWLPTDDDWDFDIGWVDGIPDCEVCGRYCLYAGEHDVLKVPHPSGDGDVHVTLGDRLSVCSVPGMPISVAFCPECLEAGAIPYGLLVCQGAMIADLSKPSITESFAPHFIHQIEHNLKFHNKTMQTYLDDVKDDIEAMNAYEANDSDEGSDGEAVLFKEVGDVPSAFSKPLQGVFFLGGPYDLAGKPEPFKSFEDGPVFFSLNGEDVEEGVLTRGDPDTIERKGPALMGCPVCASESNLDMSSAGYVCPRSDCPYQARSS